MSIPRVVICAYRPKRGKEQVLLAEVRDHHHLLRSEGLATDRTPVIMVVAVVGTTHEGAVDPLADIVDLVLIMSVNPGYGGQKYIPAATDKIRQVAALIGGRPIDLEIDGGVTAENPALVTSAGANALTGTLLVQYDTATTDVAALERTLRTALARPPLDPAASRARVKLRRHADACDHDLSHGHEGAGSCDRGHDHGHDHGHSDADTAERVRDVYAGGFTLGGVLLARLLLGPAALAGQPWLMLLLAGATLVTGRAFLRGGWRTLAAGRPLTTDTLVSSATLASIALG